jgi:hypothetical protein
LLRRAAENLRNPYRCNTDRAVDLALADLLDEEADCTDEDGELFEECVGVLKSVAIARAVLREPGGGAEQ